MRFRFGSIEYGGDVRDISSRGGIGKIFGEMRGGGCGEMVKGIGMGNGIVVESENWCRYDGMVVYEFE